MESAINNRGIYEHNLAVENELVSTLLGTSGIQTVALRIMLRTLSTLR